LADVLAFVLGDLQKVGFLLGSETNLHKGSVEGGLQSVNRIG
jgi:hypothetical protein